VQAYSFFPIFAKSFSEVDLFGGF